MTYTEVLNKIHSTQKFGIRLGLERMSVLMNALGNPQDTLGFVHVAGTNGKGSVSTMLSEIFIADGKTTGLYTSPYVVSFRERMKINGDDISENELVQVAETVFKAAEAMDDKPTEFELITAMAFVWFKRRECDVVVLEVGLGGVYDATNIIKTPLCSVITSISLDHTEYLGDSLKSVAENKAGIIKEGGRTVVSFSQTKEVAEFLKNTAHQRHNDIVFCKNEAQRYNGKTFIYKNKMYELSMLGVHQVQNAVTAIETASLLGVSPIYIRKGIKNTLLPARMELVRRTPPVILDGAHNIEGVEMLCRNVRHFFSDRNIITVLAMMEDKQWQECALKIEDISKTVIATTASNPRSLSAEQLSAYLHCEGISSCFDAFRSALNAAAADENALILVCGSLYLAGDLRDFIIRSTN